MSETLFMTHRWMAPLSLTHLVLPLLLLPHFTIPYRFPQTIPSQTEETQLPSKILRQKTPARLTNTINIIKYLSPHSQPYPESNPRGEGGTPYLHSTQTIKSSFILHLPTPPGRNTIILHQTSNAIFPHLDTCILEALHTYENPIEKGSLG